MSKESGAIKALLSATRKNERLLELIIGFEESLSEEIERNKSLIGNDERHNGFVMGLESAKSMYLVQIWQELERLYD